MASALCLLMNHPISLSLCLGCASNKVIIDISTVSKFMKRKRNLLYCVPFRDET